MSISGTVPTFSLSPRPPQTGSGVETVVTVTGDTTVGLANGTNSNESLASFYRRGLAALALSGALDTGEQRFPLSEVSGVLHFQRELAFRLADLELSQDVSNAERLARAQAELAAAGELIFGS